MKNSHYVPRLILNKFSDKLCLYNVKTCELKENVGLERAYAEKGFYSDEIEDKLNKRIEGQFANLLHNKILNYETKIELSRVELRLIKKFLLISVIRSLGSEALMQYEKFFYDNLIKNFRSQGLNQDDAIRASERPFIEKEIASETNNDYWLRTLNVILDTDGSPEEILKHPDKTYPAYRWALVINAGYLAFWDSEYKRDEFVITDIGMTSENEKGWDGITVHNDKKTRFLLKLFKDEKEVLLKKEIYKQINFVKYFHENFLMFPISARRMIVEISPFYKFRQMYKEIYYMPKLKELTQISNEKLFAANSNIYVLPQNDVIPNYHTDDKYIYEVKQLNREETRYCNALFMDRINTTLGFSSLNKAIGSILNYRKLTSKQFVPRVDYSKLYEIINDRYQGSLS